MSELYHHGILGMKWGVRRTPEQLGHKKSIAERMKEHSDRTRPNPAGKSETDWAGRKRSGKPSWQTSEKPGRAISLVSDETKNQLKRSSGSNKSDTYKEAQKQDISKLTNQQLKDYNERLQLEQNFARLTSGKVKQGKDWVMKTVVGGIVVGSVATVTKQVVQSWLKTQFGI